MKTVIHTVTFDGTVKANVLWEHKTKKSHKLYVEVLDERNTHTGHRYFHNTDKYGSTALISSNQLNSQT